MKPPIVINPTGGTSDVFKNFTLILTLCFVLYANPILATNKLNPKNPPRIGSSIDCIPPTNLAAIQPVRLSAWDDMSTRPRNRIITSNNDIAIPNERTGTLAGTHAAQSIRSNATFNVNNSQNRSGINLATKYIMV